MLQAQEVDYTQRTPFCPGAHFFFGDFTHTLHLGYAPAFRSNMGPDVVLHVAEKPSVAKSIAAILAGGAVQPSRGSGCPVWSFTAPLGGEFGGAPVANVVTSVAGHLIEIDFTGRFR